MKTVKYKCDQCGEFFIKLSPEIIPTDSITCPKCNKESYRSFSFVNISSDKEPESVSAAIEIMKHSKTPSGKQKINY